MSTHPVSRPVVLVRAGTPAARNATQATLDELRGSLGLFTLEQPGLQAP
ncbi:hypothetical protein KBI52_11755 [Microvirga sp. HBU67558]|nr:MULTISPECIES: hypothetical protein [unclassified Microvirga]MBQ0820881.1 hypothetical protein [Microvirga sp. HBU67558]